MRYKYRHPLSEGTVHGIEMPNSNHLELVDHVSIHSALAFKGREGELETLVASMPGLSARKIGPGEFYLVGEAATDLSVDGALVVDQSHGRTLFRLSGPEAKKILVKGVAVDLMGTGFPIGSSASMAFGHLGINLARVADDVFELIVLRSFAESLFHDLKLAGREYSMSFSVSER